MNSPLSISPFRTRYKVTPISLTCLVHLMVPRRRWFDKIESVNLPTRIEVFPGHGDGLPVQGYIDSSSYERVPRVCSRRYGGSGVSICIHESSLPYPLARDNAQAQARATRAKLLRIVWKSILSPVACSAMLGGYGIAAEYRLLVALPLLPNSAATADDSKLVSVQFENCSLPQTACQLACLNAAQPVDGETWFGPIAVG